MSPEVVTFRIFPILKGSTINGLLVRFTQGMDGLLGVNTGDYHENNDEMDHSHPFPNRETHQYMEVSVSS